MEWRKNQGFIITNQMMVGGTEIVLGVHENNPNSFVTWQCKGKDDSIRGFSPVIQRFGGGLYHHRKK